MALSPVSPTPEQESPGEASVAAVVGDREWGGPSVISTGVALGVTMLALLAATVVGVRQARDGIETIEEFLSARNTAGVAPVAASLVATALGTWILFSPAEAGAEFGGLTAVFGYAVGMGIPLALFATVGVRIRRLVPHGHSVTEFVLARYGRVMYLVVLAVSAAYMFVFLTVELVSIAAALAIVADVPPPVTAGLVGVFVFAYTGYGGIVASIVTDTAQTLVMLPLLAVSFAGIVAALGGTDTIYAHVLAAEPALLSLSNGDGLRFGLYVGIALVGANVLNQGLWQRVYAADSDQTVRVAFAVAAAAVVPVILLSGLFGLAAAGLGLVEHGGHAAFFRVLLATGPDWSVLLAVVVAVLLVMTSADSLLSGLASLALHDLPRVVDRLDPGQEDHEKAELLAARLITGVFAAAAVVASAAQFSEIRLFLTVDLLSAATFVPVLVGAYTGEVPEWAAMAAAVGGSVAATALDPVFRVLWETLAPVSVAAALPAASFTRSFVVAVTVSGALTALGAIVSGETVDLDRLEQRVDRLGGQTEESQP
jgi:Na+/proline symporter